MTNRALQSTRPAGKENKGKTPETAVLGIGSVPQVLFHNPTIESQMKKRLIDLFIPDARICWFG